MTVRGYPFDTTDPAGSVTELEWRRLMQWLMPSGVIRGADNAFAVTQRAAGANMSVDVATGQAFIVGHYVRSDAIESVAISNNATGNPRIDTIVVGFDFVANAATVYCVDGVTAAAPAPTALTQDLTTKWEIPLAYVYVAAGESTSIDTAEISDRRQYADPQVHQMTKEPVRLATTAALAASTVTGVVRVANANGALGNVDGVAAAVGDRVLDKDHATTQHRGIWIVEDIGSASKPWRLRRSPESDESAEVRAGMWVRVTEGSTLADTGWLLTTNDPIVLGTTGLTFTQFPAASASSFVGARGYRSTTAVTVATGTFTAIGMNAETFDTGTLHDNSTNPSRITAPAGFSGYARATFHAQFPASATGRRIWALYKNGVVFQSKEIATPSASTVSTDEVCALIPVVAGDYIEGFVYQSSGGNQDITNGSDITNLEVEFKAA